MYFLKMGMFRWIIMPVNVPSGDSALARRNGKFSVKFDREFCYLVIIKNAIY
ncbi:hypothetical protein IMM1_30990 [Pseudocoprococcus immobilis]